MRNILNMAMKRDLLWEIANISPVTETIVIVLFYGRMIDYAFTFNTNMSIFGCSF